MNKVRKPAVAGYFYPSDPEELKSHIELLLVNSVPLISVPNVFGIVSPHAGYLYSGRTAAFAYNLLKGRDIETIVIISPSHREYFPGISIYNGDAYETPLGVIPVNNSFADRLENPGKSIFKGKSGHGAEHAVEVQLPFLQVVLNEFEIVPVVMGDQNKTFVSNLSYSLAEVIDKKTLIVASSDLSHFYTKKQASELDSIVEKRITDFEFDMLQEDLDKGHCEACGGGPIVALMKTASLLNKKHAAVLNRSDSGDITGENSEVVGYLSAVIYGD